MQKQPQALCLCEQARSQSEQRLLSLRLTTQRLGGIVDIAWIAAAAAAAPEHTTALAVLCEHRLSLHCFQFGVESDRRVLLRTQSDRTLRRILHLGDGLLVVEGTEREAHVVAVCRTTAAGGAWDGLFRGDATIVWCNYGFPASTRAHCLASYAADASISMWFYGQHGLHHVVLDLSDTADIASGVPQRPTALIEAAAVQAVQHIPGKPWVVALSFLESCVQWRVYDAMDLTQVCEIIQTCARHSSKLEGRDFEELFVLGTQLASSSATNTATVNGINCLTEKLSHPGLVCVLVQKYRSTLQLDALLLAESATGGLTWAVAKFDRLTDVQWASAPVVFGSTLYVCTKESLLQIELQDTLVTTEVPLSLEDEDSECVTIDNSGGGGDSVRLLALCGKHLAYARLQGSQQNVVLGAVEI